VKRRLTLGNATGALLVLLTGIAAVSYACLSWLDGRGWAALALAAGGAALVVWAAVRVNVQESI
jgi:hypothetical protein